MRREPTFAGCNGAAGFETNAIAPIDCIDSAGRAGSGSVEEQAAPLGWGRSQHHRPAHPRVERV
jgi:hypothetical protein